MLSRLPVSLTDGAVHSILLIAVGHNMLGVSNLSVQAMSLTQAATGASTPKELGGHRDMGT